MQSNRCAEEGAANDVNEVLRLLRYKWLQVDESDVLLELDQDTYEVGQRHGRVRGPDVHSDSRSSIAIPDR
jgi:hypothetical protein